MIEFDPAFKYECYAINIPTVIGKLVLTHMDTVVRNFGHPYEQFDHIEHRIGERDKITDGELFDKVFALKATQELSDFLFEYNFPRIFMPVPDTESYEWYLSCAEDDLERADHLEQGVEDLFHDQDH